MSEKRDDGGPAYPVADASCAHEIAYDATGDKSGVAGAEYTSLRAQAIRGMSLRDAFAMAAMPALIANTRPIERNAAPITSLAYTIADAMLEARKVKP